MCNMLIVDDDPDISYTFCEASAEVAEIKCFAAQTIAEAKTELASQHIGIILLDMRLNGESGTDLAKFVNDNYPDTIIVAFTGYPDTLHSAELLKYIDDFLYKPVQIATLSDKMMTWMIAHNHKKKINDTLTRIRAGHQAALEEAREVRKRVELILGEALHHG